MTYYDSHKEKFPKKCRWGEIRSDDRIFELKSLASHGNNSEFGAKVVSKILS